MLDSVVENLVLRIDGFVRSADTWMNVHLVNILVILVGALIIRRVATELAKRLLKHIVRPDVYPTKSDREKRIKTLYSLANGVIRLVVYAIAGLMIISEIRPDYKAILFTSAGLIGAVIGFGAQNLIKDLVSGIFIITENQYRIGDEISVMGSAGIGEVNGIVEDITIRTTILRDLSGNVHHMPNGNIGVTTNKTLGFSRMNVDIVVALNTDIEKLTQLIKEVGEQLAAIPELENKVIEPPYLASIRGLSGEGMSVRVLAKTSPAAQWRTRSEFYKLLKTALDKNHIKLVAETVDET
jgi:moderate conductance mechanosensitive channel